MEITLDLPQARTRPTPGAAYAELKSTIARAGLLERRYGYYLWRALASYGILALGLVLPFVNSNRVASVAAGLLIGFGLVQVGLIGHDAGHLQIFRGTRKNWFIGLLAWTVTSGVAFWYWYDRHTRHHANTNDVQRDPDLAGGGMVAYSAEEAQARSGWSRTFAKYQAYLAPLFLLFLMIFVFYMQAEGWVYVLRRLRGRRRALELADPGDQDVGITAERLTFLKKRALIAEAVYWIIGDSTFPHDISAVPHDISTVPH